MAIRRNAIPILGKSLSKKLYKKLLTSTVSDIYIALDEDASKKALEVSEQFLNQGKNVYLLDIKDKDPSEMGFESFTTLAQKAEELDLSSLMMHKLQL